MSVRRLLSGILAGQIATVAFGSSSPPLDPAAAFGARPSVSMLSLSPDGASIAYVAPADGVVGEAFAPVRQRAQILW